MERIDNKTGVPLEHYKSLDKNLEPTTVAVRCAVVFDSSCSCFKFRFLGKDICADFPDFRAYNETGGGELSDESKILIMRYLIEGSAGLNTGQFLSYAEVPWGETYLVNFKGRCIARLAFAFGFDIGRFNSACESLGGEPAKHGDSSYDIELIDGFIVRLILWRGDDEFPPNAQILFSDNFPSAFSAEDLAVVGDVVINALKTLK